MAWKHGFVIEYASDWRDNGQMSCRKCEHCSPRGVCRKTGLRIKEIGVDGWRSCPHCSRVGESDRAVKERRTPTPEEAATLVPGRKLRSSQGTCTVLSFDGKRLVVQIDKRRGKPKSVKKYPYPSCFQNGTISIPDRGKNRKEPKPETCLTDFAKALTPGAIVSHRDHGRGKIVFCTGKTVTIDFEGKVRTLSVNVANRDGTLDVVVPAPGFGTRRSGTLAPFNVGDSVKHKRYGAGTVSAKSNGRTAVVFRQGTVWFSDQAMAKSDEWM